MADQIRIGEFELDWTSARLRGRGQDCVLPELSLRVLKVLADHAPEPVSAEMLAEQAWGQRVVSEDTLVQRIKLLRQAFGETAQDARVIVTVRGKGYRLGAPVREARRIRVPRAVWMGGAAGVALAVLGVVMLRPAAAPDPDPAAAPETPDEADLMLMRARDQMALHRAEETLRAVTLLREARRLAPERTDIATALSIALSTEVTKFSNAPEPVSEAETLARWVVEQEPANANGWNALGYALDSQGRVSEAIAAYQQAVLLNPADVYAMASAAYLLAVRGRLYDALALNMQALEGGGGPIYTELQIASVLDLLGERALADRWLARALRLNPDHPVIIRGAIEIDLSRGDDGIAAARLLSLPESQRTPDLSALEGRMALRRGDRAAARRLFEEAGPGWNQAILAAADSGAAGEPDYGWSGDTWPAGRVRAAEMAAAAGDADSAFSRLDEAVGLGWRDQGALEHSPWLTTLQSDARWDALRLRIAREIDAQRALLDADTALRTKLEAAAR